MLADRPLVVRVGDNVFVHGGVHLNHAIYGIDRINDQMHDWLLGTAPQPPQVAVANDGPIWTRAYSEGPVTPAFCSELANVLSKLHATRLIMGHTVQETGITNDCSSKAWRIDVGMSYVFGGPIQVLEIRGNSVRVLTEP